MSHAGTPKKSFARKPAALGAFLLLSSLLSPPAAAHLGPGGPVARTVALVVVGVATTANMDDGGDGAEIYITATISHNSATVNHGTVPSQQYDLTGDYDWVAMGGAGALQPVTVQLYTHVECEPSEPVTISFSAYEDDPGDGDEFMGSSGATQFQNMELSPGAEFTKTLTTTGGTASNVQVEFRAQAKAAPPGDQQCGATGVPLFSTVGLIAAGGLLAVCGGSVLARRKR